MGTAVGGEVGTLLDIAQSSGQYKEPVMLLDKLEHVLQDMPLVSCNDGKSHKSSVVTGLPKSYFARYNKGTVVSKGTETVVSDGTAWIEARSSIDSRLVEESKDPAAFRFKQSRKYYQSLAQRAAMAYNYGNVRQNPDQIAGLMERFSDPTAGNARNILSYDTSKQDGTAPAGNDFTSILLIGWSENTVHGIYPEGTMGGFEQKDLGIHTETVVNSQGQQEKMEVYQEKFTMQVGLAVPDWRYIVRGCNIKTSDFNITTPTVAIHKLITLMIEMCEHLESNEGVKACFYMNRRLRKYLRLLLKEDLRGSGLTYDTVDGRRVLAFGEYPVRISDSLTNSEEGIAYKPRTGSNPKNLIAQQVAAGVRSVNFTKAI